MYIVVSPGRARCFDEGGATLSDESVDDLPAFVAAHPEARWVWDDTRRWYPGLLAAGCASSAASTCG